MALEDGHNRNWHSRRPQTDYGPSRRENGRHISTTKIAHRSFITKRRQLQSLVSTGGKLAGDGRRGLGCNWDCERQAGRRRYVNSGCIRLHFYDPGSRSIRPSWLTVGVVWIDPSIKPTRRGSDPSINACL